MSDVNDVRVGEIDYFWWSGCRFYEVINYDIYKMCVLVGDNFWWVVKVGDDVFKDEFFIDYGYICVKRFSFNLKCLWLLKCICNYLCYVIGLIGLMKFNF